MTTDKPSLPCIICEKELFQALDLPDDDLGNKGTQPSEGIVCYSEGNYGSAIFDPLADQESLVFNICDDCLKEKAKKKLINSHYPVNYTKFSKETIWVVYDN